MDDPPSPLHAPLQALLRRYAVLGTMQPGIRRYNVFWDGIETVSTVPLFPFPSPCWLYSSTW